MPKLAYKATALDAALEDIRNGMSKKAAAKKHGVPRSTLQFRLSSKFTKKELGPPPILTNEEEDILEKWVHDCCRKGFPRRKEDLQLSVQEFLNQNERPNPFKENLPGIGWYQAFLRRHPNISLRTPEGVTAASSCVSENDIKNWFINIEEVLKEENALDVLQDPDRIFNGDETNFLLCPKGSKVLAPRGSKNVYEVDKGKAKAAVTAMFSFSANGKLVPPMLIYPYQRLPSAIVNSVPETWGIGHSDSGWMKAEVFYEYIGNVFNPHLVENNIKRPVILFVDGHKSHLSYKLSQLCCQLEIILIALYPNATRILQPADVAAFRPIKYGWKKAVMNWRLNHPAEALTKENVAPILDLVVKEIKPETLVNGFKACGLYPWNSKSIDFTKCLGKNQANMPTRNGSYVITLDQFEEIIGDEMLDKFKNIDTVISNTCEPPSFFTLYRLWEEFSRNKQSMVAHSSRLAKESQPCSSKTVSEPQQCSSKDVTKPQPCSSKSIFKSESNMPISLDHTYATPEKKKVSNIDAPILSCTPISQANGESRASQALSDILMWPVTPTRKGKKQSERVPYVVSSKKWRKLHEEKEEKKAVEEREKAERKRIREEKREVKGQKIKKEPKQRKNVLNKTKTGEKYFTMKSCIDFKTACKNVSPLVSLPTPSLKGKKPILADTKSGLCYSCGSNFKDDTESKPIECDMCDKVYHIKCAQNREDIDESDPVFICKPCLDLGNEIVSELNI